MVPARDRRQMVVGMAARVRDGEAGGTERARTVASCALAAVGVLVAGYLAAHQLHLVAEVWDPLFGPAASDRVLHSWVSRALPVPDALLGALGYLAELILAGALAHRLGRESPASRPLLALAYGAMATLMAMVALFLVAVQLLSVRAWCSLCLASAALSWALAVLAWPALGAAARALLARSSRRTVG